MTMMSSAELPLAVESMDMSPRHLLVKDLYRLESLTAVLSMGHGGWDSEVFVALWPLSRCENFQASLNRKVHPF